MDSAVVLALIAIIAAVIPALFGLLKANTTALNKIAESNTLTVREATLGRKAQERGFEEAKTRNGHLGDQNIKIAEIAAAGNKLTEQVLGALRDSNDALSRDDNGVAEAVNTVTIDHAESDNKQSQEVI